MSESDLNLNSSSASNTESLAQQVAALQRLIQSVLLLVLFISGCFMVFLWRQQRILSKQRLESQAIAQEMDTKIAPLVNGLVPALQKFAEINKDIIPLLDKYGLRQVAIPQPAPAGSAAPGATATTPATKPATPPKK